MPIEASSSYNARLRLTEADGKVWPISSVTCATTLWATLSRISHSKKYIVASVNSTTESEKQLVIKKAFTTYHNLAENQQITVPWGLHYLPYLPHRYQAARLYKCCICEDLLNLIADINSA